MESNVETAPIIKNEVTDGYSSISDSQNAAQKSRRLPQILVCIIANLASLSMGFVLGYSSPTHDQLIEEGILDEEQATWFGSLVTVGAIFGGPLAGLLVSPLGRKLTLMLLSVPYVVGWFLIAFANGPALMYCGRLLTGLAIGATSLATPLYIAEVICKELRGLLGAGFQLSAVIGIMLVYSFGFLLGHQWLAVFAAIFPTVMVLCLIWAPETPHWCISHGQRTTAIESLRKLRGPEYDVSEEYDQIERNLESQQQERTTCRDFLRPGLLRPLWISISLMLFQQFGGVNAIIFYSKTIFASAGFKSNPEVAVMILGGVQVVATFISCLLMDVAGRRVLLIIAGFFMTLSSFGFGLYYYLVDVKNVSGISVLSLVCLLVYIAAFSLGWGPIPWLVMSEIFPVRAKGIASGIATTVNWAAAFVVTKEFNDLQHALTRYGTFWGFGSVCFLSILFVAFFVPETKGRSLEDIENEFETRVSS